jgi:hypothetical protein
MRKVSSFSIGALAVLLLMLLLIGCGGGRSAPAGSNLKSMPAGRTIDLNQTLAELDALQAPEGVDAAVFANLKDSLRGMLISRGKIVLTPSNRPVNDFLEVTPVTTPPSVTWSSNFFIADGSINGSVGVDDITQIAMFFNQKPSVNPLAMVADYNRDDLVSVADLTPLAQTFGQTTGSFTIQYSASQTGPWTDAGTMVWPNPVVDKNANGFALLNFQFPSGMLADGDWYVQVVPSDTDNLAGIPCTPILVTVGGGPPPTDFIVTGMRISATGTTNTDAGDTSNLGSIRYAAPAGGGDTFGEAVANGTVLIDLDKVTYTWKGNPFDYDDPLPADLDQATYDGFIADLKGYMSYSVESLTTPIDPEAWTESPAQPAEGLEGKLGPNDDLDPPNQDAVLITAHMADNDMTQGSATFDVTVQVDLLVDPNAPFIFDFQPTSQPQNKNIISTVRFGFGADETGLELPTEVALYDKDTMTLAYTFTPAAVVETAAAPDVPGEYTLQRFPGNPDFTTQLSVLVPGSELSQGVNYVWRIAEGTAPALRSSLKKPGGVFTIDVPEMFNINTWPEYEFYWDDVRAPWLYIIPADPKIRRNPLGHKGAGSPPTFEPDDATAYDDMVKSFGGEFEIVYGIPMVDPDMPKVYFKAGTTAPATVGDADGELTIFLRQPNYLAGAAGFVPSTPGEYSFSLFNKEGTLLGSATRVNAAMPITRDAPAIVDGDFGVRPWGASGDAASPDFSDKVAHKGTNDVVVLSFYNLWLRHDDSASLPETEQGTHLVLTETGGGAPQNDLLLMPAMVSADFNGGLCYMTLDVSNPVWWLGNVAEIPSPFSYWVSVSNPGAGSSMFMESDGVTPKVLTIAP